ncbi:LOW QUALITY PROTEIN: uncharacterized protein Cpr92F [Drosophila tropicalis]|uniref:LOW QUALITY PROTEIN: uncharacterized protein Cpr92F n=1 Tax=Drosophila tropicalis TaxID=46794 RepID=UPI0035AB6CCD
MKSFLLAAAFLVSAVSGSWHGAVSTQYQHLDPHSHTYSYGYADPNSQKHETRSHDGTTHGSYSYVDGHGHLQSVSYTADPHHGFNAVGTNLPKAPLAHGAPVYAAAHAHSAYVPYAHHAHGIHIPVLTHGGVPVDTPEVQHAKAAHAAAHAAAAHNAGGHHLYKRSIYGGPWAYGGAAHVPLTHGGVPVDTPDVQAAKAEHYAAHAKALGHVAHGHGAPVDTAEVQHAKAAHFAAHAAARSGHAIAPIAHGGYHVPVIHNGVPVDTPEVQHAKAAHYAAVSQASSHASSHSSWDGGYDGQYDGRWDGGHDSHAQSYASGYAHKGPIHIPVIHNGVPVEPAEVQHARAAHLNALAAASHGSHGGYYGGGAAHEDDGQYHAHYDHY